MCTTRASLGRLSCIPEKGFGGIMFQGHCKRSRLYELFGNGHQALYGVLAAHWEELLDCVLGAKDWESLTFNILIEVQ